MMSRYLLITALTCSFILHVNCGTQRADSPLSIVITGEIVSPVLGDIQCRLNMDGIIPVFEETTYVNDTTANVRFRFETQSEVFLTGYVMHARSAKRRAYLFLEPGDSQHVVLGAVDSGAKIEITGRGGNNSSAYMELKRILVLSNQNYQKLWPKYPDWLSHKAFVDSFQQDLWSQVRAATSRFDKTQQYLDYERAEKHFTDLYRMSNFWIQHPDSNTCRTVIDSLIDLYPKFADIGLSTSEYVSFLVMYPWYTMDSVNLKKFLSNRQSAEQNDSILRESFPPRIYAWWMVSQKSSGIWLDPIKYEKFYRQFTSENIFAPYTAYIQKRYAEGMALRAADSVASTKDLSGYCFVNNEHDTLCLRDLKGKVVLLDFWASWCGPCIAEVPYIKKIKKQLKQEPVIFVNISLDTDSLKWLNAIRKYPYPGFQSLISEDNKSILKDLNVRSLPKYILIDKEGSIAQPNAIRPSLGLHEDIKRLL